MARAEGFLVPGGQGRFGHDPIGNRWHKVIGADTDGAFMVVEFVLESEIPPHVHLRQHESFYVLEGSLEVRVGDDEFVAGPDDFVFLPAEVPHAIAPNSDKPPKLLVIATPNALGGVVPLQLYAGQYWGHDQAWYSW